jgi:hypothetical protein
LARIHLNFYGRTLFNLQKEFDMSDSRGQKFIKAIKSKWVFSGLIASFIFALSISLIGISIWNIFSDLPYWYAAASSIILSFAIVQFFQIVKINEEDVARLLNQFYPQLEESSSLVLKEGETLNILEKLQVKRIENELIKVQIPALIYKRLKKSAIFLLFSISISLLISQIDASDLKNKTIGLKEGKFYTADKILPEIASITLNISPPSYTNKDKRAQKQFSATVEDGSMLEWTIETNQSVESLKFIFNDSETSKLRPLNKNKTLWTLNKRINKSGFYQVSLDDQLSDLYKLEIIKDEPVLIRISSPKQYSTIDYGEEQISTVQVQVNDDYGVNEVYISATISSGQGEGVEFKEHTILFSDKINGEKEYKLQKTINLTSLGMKPGDELYFFIHAMDSRNQTSRSDVYQVSIQDTAKLMSMDGMMGGVNLIPEYFRSQRQIIIDTEKILKEKNSISTEEFKSRSNNLGIDQKLLRLRYGKFLGEESEGDIGGGNEDHEDEEAGADFGNAEKIIDSYAHKHDVAEDATFFEPDLKAQLKATLTEMWKSELRLRTYKPQEALPFEYKALRLLKDLQQKSRAYVSKTALKTAAIKPEKRLTGELDKIIQPMAERKILKNEAQSSLKEATAIIAKLKTKGSLNLQDRAILQEANRKIASKAISEPSSYLNAFEIMRKIISANINLKVSPKEFSIIESALQKIIRDEGKMPQARPIPTKTSLSTEYFNRLKQVQP